MSWSAPKWQVAAAVASCLLGSVLLILPSLGDWGIDAATAASPSPVAAATKAPATTAVVKSGPVAQAGTATTVQVPAMSPARERAAAVAIPPAPEVPVATPQNRAKARALALQAKALLDACRGDPSLLAQASELIDAALTADARSAETLIEQSRLVLRVSGSRARTAPEP